MMNTIDITKRDLIFLTILSAFAAVFAIVWMAATGNTPQVYNDIVIELLALLRMNKSAEILCFRLLFLFGSIAVFLYVFIFRFKVVKNSGYVLTVENSILAWFCFVIMLDFLIYGKISQIIALALIFCIVTFIVDKTAVVPTVCHFFISYYVCHSLYQICNFLGSYGNVKLFSNIGSYPASVALVFAVFSASLPFLFKNRKDVQKMMLLLYQLVIPALFLILSIKKYNDHGNTVIIAIPRNAKIFIGTIIIIFFCDTVRLIRKMWTKRDFDTSDLLSIGTCIAIMYFNTYAGNGAVFTSDLHHPFENVFAFQQIFEFGRVPYKDFIPPSGLYSVVEGFFFWFFGDGKVSFYWLSNNIFYLCAHVLLLLVLQFHVSKKECFAVALFLSFPTFYNRLLFIAFIALVLLLPALVKRTSLWLQVFCLLSLFHLLYYPVYGVATAVGFIPLFIFQIRSLVFAANNNSFKSAGFWISWTVVLGIVVFSIPLVWGTFIHTLSMSDQSLLADGLAVFGAAIPDSFMPYAKNFFRYPIYKSLRFVLPSLMIWLPVLFLSKIISKEKYSMNEMIFNIERFSWCFTLILIPLISYIFTLIRFEVLNIFGRNYGVYINLFVLYLVFLRKYTSNSNARFITYILMTVVLLSCTSLGVEKSQGRMFSAIEAPDDYVFVDNNEYDTLGSCFLSDVFLEASNYWEHKYENKFSENDEASFSKFTWFGLYHVFSQKGGANIEAYTVRGYNASKETREMCIKNNLDVGSFDDPLFHYYLYNWLIASGDYVYDTDKKLFVPNHDMRSFEEIRQRNLRSHFFQEDYDLGSSADVWGLSFQTLKKIFTETSFPVVKANNGNVLFLQFTKPFWGYDADFLYIEFDRIQNEYVFTEVNSAFKEVKKNMSGLLSRLFLKVKPNPDMQIFVHFYDEEGFRHCVKANYGNGKLLINLGCGARFLLENHSSLEISVCKNGEVISMPNVKDMKFLKCRQIYTKRF